MLNEWIFESHAHFDDKQFDPDREELLSSMEEHGIGRIINVGSDFASCKHTLELTQHYEFLYGALGIHPSDIADLNEEVYEALEQAGLPEKKMQRIRAMRAENIDDKEMKFLAGTIRKYTSGYFNKKGEQVPILPVVKGLLASEDYTIKDFKAIMVNGAASAKGLMRSILQLDLTEELSAVDVPYYILQGDTDIVTSTRAVQREVEASGNPHLDIEVIENTGHMPGKMGMEAVLETLIKAITSLPTQ